MAKPRDLVDMAIGRNLGTRNPLLILLQSPGIIGSGSTALLFSPL